jgi:hypothetical protein
MIRFYCANCQKALKAPKNAAGRKTKCPGCGQSIQVPLAVPPVRFPKSEALSANPILEVLPVLDEETNTDELQRPIPEVIEVSSVSRLIPCSECGRSIAKEAAACPGCGAPNKWAHPEIRRFLRCLHRFDHLPRFNIHWERYVLAGVDEASHRTAQRTCNTVGSFGILAPISVTGLVTLAGFHVGSQLLQGWATRRVKAFRIDFRTSPPIWASTDDDWWSEILDFFGL